MNVIGYIRVSSDRQDLQKQEHLLLKYAQQQDLQVGEFINIEISSRKGTKERRIGELLDSLNEGDILLVAELSRLGRGWPFTAILQRQSVNLSPCEPSKDWLPREQAAKNWADQRAAVIKKEFWIHIVSRLRNISNWGFH